MKRKLILVIIILILIIASRPVDDEKASRLYTDVQDSYPAYSTQVLETPMATMIYEIAYPAPIITRTLIITNTPTPFPTAPPPF